MAAEPGGRCVGGAAVTLDWTEGSAINRSHPDPVWEHTSITQHRDTPLQSFGPEPAEFLEWLELYSC